MLDESTTGGSTSAPRCNWCSAVLPSDHEVTCPSCGATLLGDSDPAVPGLTAIDAEAILRNARTAKAKPRGRLLSWISGDYDDSESTAAASPGSLAPPTGAVRREMLRLEIEAQLTNAQAEVEAMAVDAALEEGRSLESLVHTDADVDVDETTTTAADVAPAADPDAAASPAAADDRNEAPPA